jgi:shikimate dehydrogenase
MTLNDDIAPIQNYIANRLDNAAIGDRRVAGVIGDAPSQYSKSPTLWNAAFSHLDMNAVYLPFDVAASRLKDLVFAFRDCDRFMGMNVTVSHKVRIMEFLDELDQGVQRIQAVNTVVRTRAGRLIGYNTDGDGFMESISTAQSGQSHSFVAALKGLDVLLLGAGGAARAVALHLSNYLDGGKLVISNRTLERAASLAAEIRKFGGNATAIGESEIPDWAPRVGLIINSTTKGQGGLRRLENGKVITMEPYSALAPANPVAVPDALFESHFSAEKASQGDIQNNNDASLKLATAIPKSVRFYDLIYFPEETVFLCHGKLTGHPTMNGKAMIVNQAAIAFCQRICRKELQAKKIDSPETFRDILKVMYRAWEG